MLKPPKRFFGFMPTWNFLAHFFFAVFFCLIPLGFLVFQAITGVNISNIYAFSAGIRLIILAVYVKIVFFSGSSFFELLTNSKRTRYVGKTLVPFFRERYGVEVEAKSSIDAYHFCTGSPVEAHLGTEHLNGVILTGWEAIEKTALDGVDVNLEDNVYLLQEKEPGIFIEFPRLNEPNHESVGFNRLEPAIPLNETEDLLHSMVTNMIHSLPTGEASLICFPKDGQMGTSKELEVKVDVDGDLSYSSKQYQSLIEATLFNVRLMNEALFLCTLVTPEDKVYISGRIVKNDGVKIVPPAKLKEITIAGGFEDDGLIFVENMNSIKEN